MVKAAPFLYILSTITLFLLSASIAFGQLDFDVSGFGSYQPELLFTPVTPEPGGQVRVEIGNFLSSLQGSEIFWYRDGVLLNESQNQPNLSFTAGELNKPSVITAQLKTLSGRQVEISGTITPRYLDIIVEAQTYVPEFYTGRPLPSVGSQVNVTALLDGNVASNYVYAWRVNGDLLGGASGRGIYTTNFTMPMDSRVVLSLSVFDVAGNLYASKSVLLPNTKPFIKFYEVNTLYGVNPNTYESLILSGNNATILAVPYYLDTRVYNQPDIVDWKVGKQSVPNSGNPYEITIEKQNDRGQATLSFRVQSTTSLLQGTSGNIDIIY